MDHAGGVSGGARRRARAIQGRHGLVRLLALPVVLALALPGLGYGSGVAHAADVTRYVAINGSDANNNDCASISNPCATLAHAVNDIAQDGDTIIIGPGTFTDQPNVDQTDVQNGGTLTIQGAGAGSTILDGNHLGTVITVDGGNKVTIEGVTIENGSIVSTSAEGCDPAFGGGILNFGNLTLIASIVTNNSVSSSCDIAGGGGIASDGHLRVVDSTITANTATTTGGGDAFGGGIYNARVARVISSTVSNNTATATGTLQVGAYGGGIYNTSRSLCGVGAVPAASIAPSSIHTSVLVQECAVTANTVVTPDTLTVGDEVALDSIPDIGLPSGTLLVRSSTIDHNTASANFDAYGGGIAFNSGKAPNRQSAANTTVAYNTAQVTGNIGETTAYGGGISGPSMLVNDTINNNTAAGGTNTVVTGGGIAGVINTHSLYNTIVVTNTPTDCGVKIGPAGDHGGNLDSDGTCNFTKLSSKSSGNANLGPLQNNGGPVFTEALGIPSDARNLGLDTTCLREEIDNVDARGLPRHAEEREACDSGAWDSGDGFTNPGTIVGAIQFPTLPGHVGFFGTTSAGSPLGYITFQDGPNSFIVNSGNMDAVYCPDQCVGTPTIPIPGPTMGTLTLSGDIQRGWGWFAKGGIYGTGDDEVVVTFTIQGTLPTMLGKPATFTVTSVTVSVDGHVLVPQTLATAGPHANLFTGHSNAIYLPLSGQALPPPFLP